MNKSCNFYSIMWRLERLSLQDDVSLLPVVNMAFPAQEVACQNQTTIWFNFLTLLGVDSPYPHYLIVLGLESEAFRAFLAVFNQRLVKLLYFVWRRTHPLLNSQSVQQLLMALLGEPKQVRYAWQLLPKTAVNFKRFLKNYFYPFPVKIIENDMRFYKIQQLGQHHLGKTTVLGQRCMDHQFSITLIVGPVPDEQSLALQPLFAVLKHYFAEYDFKLQLVFCRQSLPIRLNDQCLLQSEKVVYEI